MGGTMPCHRKSPDDKEKAQWYKRYVEDGWTLGAVAKVFHRAPETISRWLISQGVVIVGRGNADLRVRVTPRDV